MRLRLLSADGKPVTVPLEESLVSFFGWLVGRGYELSWRVLEAGFVPASNYSIARVGFLFRKGGYRVLFDLKLCGEALHHNDVEVSPDGLMDYLREKSSIEPPKPYRGVADTVESLEEKAEEFTLLFGPELPAPVTAGWRGKRRVGAGERIDVPPQMLCSLIQPASTYRKTLSAFGVDAELLFRVEEPLLRIVEKTVFDGYTLKPNSELPVEMRCSECTEKTLEMLALRVPCGAPPEPHSLLLLKALGEGVGFFLQLLDKEYRLNKMGTLEKGIGLFAEIKTLRRVRVLAGAGVFPRGDIEEFSFPLLPYRISFFVQRAEPYIVRAEGGEAEVYDWENLRKEHIPPLFSWLEGEEYIIDRVTRDGSYFLHFLSGTVLLNWTIDYHFVHRETAFLLPLRLRAKQSYSKDKKITYIDCDSLSFCIFWLEDEEKGISRFRGMIYIQNHERLSWEELKRIIFHADLNSLIAVSPEGVIYPNTIWGITKLLKKLGEPPELPRAVTSFAEEEIRGRKSWARFLLKTTVELSFLPPKEIMKALEERGILLSPLTTLIKLPEEEKKRKKRKSKNREEVLLFHTRALCPASPS